VRVTLAGDGWRYRAACLGGCGGTAIVVLAHVRDPWCSACLRRHHRVDEAIAATRAAGDVPTGAPWPRVARHSTGAVSLRKTRVLLSVEVASVDWKGDDRVPTAAYVLADRVGGRVLLSVARRGDSPTTAAGKASAKWAQTDTFVSVQWRVAGRPPTIMAVWKNGQRDHAMVGERRVTHTDVGAL